MTLFYRQGSRFVVVWNRMVGVAVLQHLGEILAELITDKLQCCITLLGINVTNNKKYRVHRKWRSHCCRSEEETKRNVPRPNLELLIIKCVINIIY